jgi:hypothetical protein
MIILLLSRTRWLMSSETSTSTVSLATHQQQTSAHFGILCINVSLLLDTVTTSLNSHFPAFNLFPLTMTTIIGAHCCSSFVHSVNRKAKRNLPLYYRTQNAVETRKLFLFHGATAPSRSGPPYVRGFMITLRHTHTPLYEWSARRRDLFLTTQHSQEKDMHAPSGFEPIISASERSQTYALDRAATGVARKDYIVCIFSRTPKNFEIFITFFIFHYR